MGDQSLLSASLCIIIGVPLLYAKNVVFVSGLPWTIKTHFISLVGGVSFNKGHTAFVCQCWRGPPIIVLLRAKGIAFLKVTNAISEYVLWCG